jgi:CRP-like cAMP-binding protein
MTGAFAYAVVTPMTHTHARLAAMMQREAIEEKIMYIDHATQAGLTEAYAATRMANPLFHQFCELPICQHMQLEESMQLFNCFDVARTGSGDTIYAAGSDSDKTMRLIVSGTASVSSPSSGTYSHLGAGDVFGLFSFLDESRTHAATVIADDDMTLLCIDRDYFNLITLEDASLGNLLLRFMFHLLSQVSLKVESEYAAMHHYLTGRCS